jgi:hypothetical protein
MFASSPQFLLSRLQIQANSDWELLSSYSKKGVWQTHHGVAIRKLFIRYRSSQYVLLFKFSPDFRLVFTFAPCDRKRCYTDIQK